MPVTISIVLDESYIDAGSLVQPEMNENALRTIQEVGHNLIIFFVRYCNLFCLVG